jgi:16S rRNA (uracil1498-N3)-methyltransferase
MEGDSRKSSTLRPDPLPPEARRLIVSLPEVPVSLPAELAVTDIGAVRRLATVCRARPGERLALVDALREKLYAATVQTIGRDGVVFRLDTELPTPADTLPHVMLIAALIKEQRWDVLLQKTAELGVRAIRPVVAERSVVRLTPSDATRKRARWEGILRSAAEQSEGLFIPELTPPVALPELLDGLSDGQSPLKILLMERGPDRTPLKTLLRGVRAKQPVILAIGPEGGWTDGEARAFQAAGFRLASMGGRILRSETAAMAAMAALMVESWAENENREVSGG